MTATRANLSLGVQSLVNRFDGELNTVEFLLPTQVASTL